MTSEKCSGSSRLTRHSSPVTMPPGGAHKEVFWEQNPNIGKEEVIMRRLLAYLLASVVIVSMLTLITGCVRRSQLTCAPGTEIDSKMINFICPRCGAGYQAEAVLCAGENHYQVDTTCPVCGYNYKHTFLWWPYPYTWADYYFYNSHWYPREYWNRYWSYPYYPAITVPQRPAVPTQPRTPTPPPAPRPNRGQVPMQPPPSKIGSGVQRPPVPVRPPAPITRNPAPQTRPPAPPPVTVKSAPVPPPTPPVKK
jgi:predicted RNA-binding Zn-ribbon protein involved in translation (DUF1610 family)